MSKGSAPAAPDPVATANAQTASNIATATNNAALNRVDQVTPYGSSTYDIKGYEGSTPQYKQTVTLSPEQQALYDKYTQGQTALADTALGSLGNVQSNIAQPFSLRNDPTTSDFGTQIKNSQDAAYRGQTQYLDPQFKNAQSDLDSKLANQGLQVGGEAYGRAQDDLARQKQMAYQGAQDSAVQAGANIQNQGFNQGLQGAGLQFAEYNQPLSTYNSLITGSQPTNPTFGNVPGVNQANTDVAGITNSGYQNQLSRYNAQQQGINNLFSLGGSLGGAAILASDRRLKRNIERIGITGSGIPIYEFSYIWDGHGERHVGVMADEVRPIMPNAVITHSSGFDMVDYSQVRP